MSDNRKYNEIVRVDERTKDAIRAYAAERSITPNEACIVLVGKALEGGQETAGFATRAECDRANALPADLEVRLLKLAERRGVTLDEIKVYALGVAAGRLESVDRYADGKKVVSE